VARAEHDGLIVVPAGLGAHLDVGGPPVRVDVLLRLDRLARVVDHQAADMTVTVEAGCPLAVLDSTLAARGQWLPLDPPRAAQTDRRRAHRREPLGSAPRDAGRGARPASRHPCRRWRRALVSGGGRVVKNVAGYDVPKLHIGPSARSAPSSKRPSRCARVPAREEALVIACRDTADAAELASAFLDAGAPPLWIEIDGADDGAVAVSVGLAGIEDEVLHARDVARRIAAGRALRPVNDAVARRAELVDFGGGSAAAVLRAAVLPSEIGAVLAALTKAGIPLRFEAHAASGVVRAAIRDAAAVAPLVRGLRPDIESRGGSLVVERAVPAVKQAVDVWGDPGPGLTLMRGVKGALDPAGVFAIGRFVGGYS
jgi:glycolate oxidase FAD binding subunit